MTPSLLRANKAAFRLLGCSQPMRRVLTLTAEVHLGRCSPPAAGSRSAALRSPPRKTTQLRVGGAPRRLAVTAFGTERSTAAHNVRTLFFRGFNASKKLSSARMQSESGIVPDFEVGEDFQEEPKTYYELKSQPLKSRSVVKLRTVISQAAARFGV